MSTNQDGDAMAVLLREVHGFGLECVEDLANGRAGYSFPHQGIEWLMGHGDRSSAFA